MPKKNPQKSHNEWTEIHLITIRQLVKIQSEKEDLETKKVKLEEEKAQQEEENVKLRGENLKLQEAKAQKEEENVKLQEEKLRKESDLEKFIERQIGELREELECPVCLEVATKAPIYKCTDDHIICRYRFVFVAEKPHKTTMQQIWIYLMANVITGSVDQN